MKKILLSSLIALATLVPSTLHAGQFEHVYNGIRYLLNIEDKTATVINDYENSGIDYYSKYYGDIVIPDTVYFYQTNEEVTGFAVKKIDADAFYASSISSIVIPNTVTRIEYYAFGKCGQLHTVNLPANITSISDETFYACESLVSITIPEGVTYIGNGAFYKCTSLPVINIPNSTVYIGHRAFGEAKKLVSISIPENVISIGDYAFESCEKLTNITIPQGTISIGDGAFSNCSRLASITNHATVPQTVISETFNGVNKSTCTLYVPEESIEQYRTAIAWEEFENIRPIRAEGIDQVETHTQGTKLFRDGQIYIHQGDKAYTITGQEIK